MNSGDREGNSQRALVHTAILPESLDASGREHRGGIGSPRSVGLARALQPPEDGPGARQDRDYLARERSNEEVRFSQRKSPREKEGHAATRHYDSSLGPLQLSMELEQLDIGEPGVPTQKKEERKVYRTGTSSPTGAENTRPHRSVRFVNLNEVSQE